MGLIAGDASAELPQAVEFKIFYQIILNRVVDINNIICDHAK